MTYLGFRRGGLIAFIAFALNPLLLRGAIDEHSALTEAWEATTLTDFGTAVQKFKTLIAAHDPAVARQAHYGLAINLLNAPPTTESSRNQAARLLTEVVAAGDSCDELTLAARYHLARIDHSHRLTPDYPRALAAYLALAEAHSVSWWGQLALQKAALIDLFSTPPGEDYRERCNAWWARLDAFHDPVIRRGFAYLMGDAFMRVLRDPAGALRCYLEAESLQLSRHDLRALMLMRTALLSRELGHTAEAVARLRRYIAEFPQTGHGPELQRIVNHLEAQLTAIP
jgi:hypothetical protein